MSTYTERAIQACLTREMSEADADRVITLDTVVRRDIACQVSGRILDTRTAVLFEVTVGDQVSWAAVDPSAAHIAMAQIAESLPDSTTTMFTVGPLVAQL